MILNKLFKGLVILSLCVASATSCVKDGNNQGGTIKPSDCKPGDDFFTYANAEWLESLDGANNQKTYGFFHELDEVNSARVKAIQDAMDEYKMLKQGVAKREANVAATDQFLEKLAADLLTDVDTREEVYVLFGKAIRFGVPAIATLHTGICREDNTFGFYFAPPVMDETSVTGIHSAATTNHHVVSRRLCRYTPSTRGGKTTMDYIIEGIGFDPQYYLYDEVSEAIVGVLEEEDIDELRKNIGQAILMELVRYESDEYAQACTGGQAKSVQDLIDQCMEKDLGYFTSYHFSNAHPTTAAEPAFKALGDELTASFRKRLENNQWLSPTTQQAAIEKLDYMGSDYGTPKKWPVTDIPQLNGELLVTDVITIKECRYNVIKSLLGKSVKEYYPFHYMFYSPIESLYSYEVNAFYDPAFNAFYVLPPFMLEPAYTANMDECKLYATWGVVIGHEMTHGFDKTGATYDKNGEMNNWWTEGDAAKFAELNERRAANVSTHEVLPGMKSNGTQTVTEDVADLGGFNIAYDLWVKKLKERGVEGEELDEMKRQFFINFAAMYSEKLPKAEMIERAKEDIHSAGHVRVNSVVQHIDDWYELFDITEGDALYLAPEQRITIW